MEVGSAHCGCRTQDTLLMHPPPWASYVPGGGTVGLSPPPDHCSLEGHGQEGCRILQVLAALP